MRNDVISKIPHRLSHSTYIFEIFVEMMRHDSRNREMNKYAPLQLDPRIQDNNYKGLDSPKIRSPNNSHWLFCCAVVIGVLMYLYTCLITGYEPTLGCSSGPGLFSASIADPLYLKEWLKHQKNQLISRSNFASSPMGTSENNLAILSSALNSTVISRFEPFSTINRVGVWDLYAPQVSCPDLVRIGYIGDGGKWICGTTWLAEKAKTSQKCVIYSFGINIDSTFELEVGGLSGCEIHAFDPTVGKMPFMRMETELSSLAEASQQNGVFGKSKFLENQEVFKRVTFHKIALGTISGSSEDHTMVETLYDIMHRLNHSFIDVLKVDIEGSEWPVFSDILAPFLNDGYEYPRQSSEFRAVSLSELRNRRSHVKSSHLLMEDGDTKTIPIGQVLIELHFKSMPITHRFFKGMFSAGFVSVAREINLQPCLDKADPVAVEYVFINPHTFFAEKSALPFRGPPAASNPYWHAKIDAVIYYLTQRARLQMMKDALALLYKNFWRFYPVYPVVIFQDDLGPTEKQELQAAVPRMKLTFIAVDFKLPANLDPRSVPERTKCAPKSSTLGYRHMCQFHSTGVHSMLRDNGFANTEYIMRLDDDSAITAPVGYDWFRFMKANKKLYGFVNTLQDDDLCIEGLWSLSRRFINSTAAPLNRTKGFFDEWPDGLVFYNNFEISHVSLWRDPVWIAYMAVIEESGGIYTKRWGDAPIHTIAASLILSKEQVHAFSDVGYTHEPFVKQRPGGLPRPHADPFRSQDTNCIFYERWICSNHSTGNWTNSSAGFALANPIWSKDRNSFSFHRAGGAVSGLSQAGSASSRISLPPLLPASTQRTVLFCFGHAGREQVLARSIASFYDGFARAAGYPFVIFHSKRTPSFDVDRVLKMIGANWTQLITFVPVDLDPYLLRHGSESAGRLTNASAYPCIPSSPEVYGATRFLRFDAAQALVRLGFEWFIRFSDNSKLVKPIDQNLITSMVTENRRYGFINVIRETPSCIANAWAQTEAVCSGRGPVAGPAGEPEPAAAGIVAMAAAGIVADNNSSVTGGSTVALPEIIIGCSPLLASWPRGVIVFNNFEVSHASVWQTPACRALHLAVEKDAMAYQVWGDALLHTLCVISALDSADLKRFDDIHYETKLEVDTAAKQSSLQSAHQGVALVETAGNLTHRFTPGPAHLVAALEAHFLPRRFGWLGGDVAASVALPDVRARSLSAAAAPAAPALATTARKEVDGADKNGRDIESQFPRQYLWLFGDSLIGTSTASRRLEGQLVCNAVGVASMQYTGGPGPQPEFHTTVGAISSMRFYWGSSTVDGSPQPVFRPELYFTREDNSKPERKSTEDESSKVAYWPTSGIAIGTDVVGGKSVATVSDVRLVVLGQLVEQVSATGQGGVLDTGSALSFRETGSAAFLVSNPYEAPDTWQYKAAPLPAPLKGKYRWMTIVEENGLPVASATGWLYLLGTYSKDESDAAQDHSQFDVFSVIGAKAYMTLSRIPAAAVLRHDFSTLEIYCDSIAGPGDALGKSRRSQRRSHRRTVGLGRSDRNDTADGASHERAARRKEKNRFTSSSSSGGESGSADGGGDGGDGGGGVGGSASVSTGRSRFDARRSDVEGAEERVDEWRPVEACSSPRQLFAPTITEPSLHLDPRTGDWIIASLQITDKAVKLCKASAITGPWGCDFVASIPPQWTGKDYISYGAKLHPELQQQQQQHQQQQLLRPTVSSKLISSTASSVGSHADQSGLKRNGNCETIDFTISYVPNAMKGPSFLFSDETRIAYTPKFILLSHQNCSSFI